MAERTKTNLKSKKRIIFVFGTMALLLILLLFRMAWIQVVSKGPAEEGYSNPGKAWFYL